MATRIFVIVMVLCLFIAQPVTRVQSESTVIFLPVVISERQEPKPEPTASPQPTERPTFPPPPAGDNVNCGTNGSAQLCAWVSNGNPVQNSFVTVYGRLYYGGTARSGQPMVATWHYKTTTPICTAPTDASGVASCFRSIGNATIGQTVTIEVSIGGYVVSTSFTPQ